MFSAKHALANRLGYELFRVNSVNSCIRRRSSIRSYVSTYSFTKIEKIILDNIKAAGPITFASYMQMCLSHPTHGYYTNPANSIFGTQGDFVTSPEISQVFGELVGVWLLSQWMQGGPSRKIRLVELGPGRGTLMEDILRTLSRFPSCADAIRDVHLIETSQSLCSIQENRLRPLSERLGINIEWHDGLDRLPVESENDAFTMVVAHEFFDALPFHLLENTNEGWKELLIASLADSLTTKNVQTTSERPSDTSATYLSRFQTVLSATPLSRVLATSSPRFSELPVGTHLEVSPVAWSIARQVAHLVSGNGIAQNTGCALIIDYGDDHVFGKSFRAFKNHKVVDPFARPGECDLTVNVDFAYLKEAVDNLAKPLGPVSQADFLVGMGLEQRIEVLARSALDSDRAALIRGAARRLVDRNGMGEQYKVLGLIGKDREIKAETLWPFVET